MTERRRAGKSNVLGRHDGADGGGVGLKIVTNTRDDRDRDGGELLAHVAYQFCPSVMNV